MITVVEIQFYFFSFSFPFIKKEFESKILIILSKNNIFLKFGFDYYFFSKKII